LIPLSGDEHKKHILEERPARSSVKEAASKTERYSRTPGIDLLATLFDRTKSERANTSRSWMKAAGDGGMDQLARSIGCKRDSQNRFQISSQGRPQRDRCLLISSAGERFF
jgi:hypothetical protein